MTTKRIYRRYITRPYKHVTTKVTDAGVSYTTVHGTYASLAAAIVAAQKADRTIPDGTRAILLGRWSVRNRYAHGSVSTWMAD